MRRVRGRGRAVPQRRVSCKCLKCDGELPLLIGSVCRLLPLADWCALPSFLLSSSGATVWPSLACAGLRTLLHLPLPIVCSTSSTLLAIARRNGIGPHAALPSSSSSSALDSRILCSIRGGIILPSYSRLASKPLNYCCSKLCRTGFTCLSIHPSLYLAATVQLSQVSDCKGLRDGRCRKGLLSTWASLCTTKDRPTSLPHFPESFLVPLPGAKWSSAAA